ncbi:unc-50 -like protein [Asbolus verrucosus]|uniref:Unc-50-like protein n=1 Tax=Asbolus verrucosus TaxID=1661398 RepID=A0A482W988_ASBVE|nr:unc-50 -like protein [Asbolus verrucosus]
MSIMNSSLPLPSTQRDCMSAATKRYIYLRRMLKFDQMDFEFAFWQMLYLFIAPEKVYRNFRYRKQTKSQFARDDPAFLVLFAAWLCITSVGFAIVLKLGFWQFINFLLFVLNKYFRPSTEVQDVEWGYSFDLFFYNGLISHEWFISRLLGNTFWLVAVLYYMYITFLGYSSLQILNHTHLILTPVPIVIIFYIISLTKSSLLN